MRLPMKSGRFYAPTLVTVSDASFTDADYLFALPIYVPNTIDVASLSIVLSTGEANAEARVGVYSDSNGYPDALQFEADAPVDCSGSGVQTAAASGQLTQGWHWLACVVTGNIKLQSSVQSEATLEQTGADTPGNAILQISANAGIAAQFTYASLPATFPEGGLAAAIVGTPCPVIAMEVA